MKLLIVEDSPYKLQQVSDCLQHGSYDVAKSYNSAVRKLLKEEYDAVILDMCFPNFDDSSVPEPEQGLNVLRQMKRKKIEIPVLVYSSDVVDVSAYSFVTGYIVADNTCIESRISNFLSSITQ